MNRTRGFRTVIHRGGEPVQVQTSATDRQKEREKVQAAAEQELGRPQQPDLDDPRYHSLVVEKELAEKEKSSGREKNEDLTEELIEEQEKELGLSDVEREDLEKEQWYEEGKLDTTEEQEEPVNGRPYERADLDGMSKDEVEQLASDLGLEVEHGEDPSRPARKEDLVKAILSHQQQG